MNKKKGILLLAAVLVIVLVAITMVRGDKEEKVVQKNDETEQITDTEEETEKTETKKEKKKEKKEEAESETEETVSEEASSSGEETYAEEQNIQKESQNEAAENQVENITFPYQIPDTGLVIEKLNSYDGAFIEDGTDEEVYGITAAVIRNAGEENLEYAEITLERDGEPLVFRVSTLPAGATVAVQEAERKTYQEGTYQNCTAVVAELDKFEKSKDEVKVEETEDGSLRVTNLTKKELPCVRIFYKLYMEDADTYIGGITYTAKVTELEAGKSQDILPSHYSKESSKIMMIRIYDTTE